jgi:hypothetical protein
VFHEYFTEMGGEIREHEVIYVEHVAGRRLLAAVGAGHAFRPFKSLPNFIGHSASLGVRYHGIRHSTKWFLRQQVRRIVTRREILL